MAQDKSQKTEPPSQKKIADARKEGKLPMSRELVSFFILSIMSIFFLLFFPYLLNKEFLQLKNLMANSGVIDLDLGSMTVIFKKTIKILFNLLSLPLLLCLAAIIAANIIQKGFVFSLATIKFKLDNISILKGIKRLFSLTSIFELIKGILKIIIVASIVYTFTISSVGQLIKIANIDFLAGLNFSHKLVLKVIGLTAIVVGLIGILDLLFQRYKYFSDLMMTKEEVKKEHKETEGDPKHKAKLKSIRIQKMQERMMSAVPEADVVITNPTHFAIALKYDDNMAAPIVLAKGLD